MKKTLITNKPLPTQERYEMINGSYNRCLMKLDSFEDRIKQAQKEII